MTEIYEPTLEIFSEGETYDFLLKKLGNKMYHHKNDLEKAEQMHEEAVTDWKETRKFMEKMREILYQAEKDYGNLEAIMERQAKKESLER